MRESWRWFGPNDPVSLNDIRQTGATDIVSALHNIPAGEVWTEEAIVAHKNMIESCSADESPLAWTVVESIPVHESIKLNLPGCDKYIDAWITSMENLAKHGIKVICYNFMPVIDWTRTDLKYKLPSGAYTLRFDQHKFAAFDLFILQRDNAEADYSEHELLAAKQTYESMSEQEKETLTANIIAGLPGKMTDSYNLDTFKAMLAQYQDIDEQSLRNNLFRFLSRVVPKAEAVGMKLAIHPDDPPRSMFGLPRIICTADDLDILFAEIPSEANGITLCVGTYSSRPDNNLVEMAGKFAPRIHFSHLRGVARDPGEQRSFQEASHLDGDVDMIGVVEQLLREEKRREQLNTGQLKDIFIRPDHGHQMLDDINRQSNPGYSAIGRLKGLAEIRGVIRTVSRFID
ncbi:mannonate dehydratase [Alteromonas gilva]|uniref:Mannonate dehydratase n=1 Tax=Alteromonas gilva TaxID=2987522 RepID=A0ABT5L493_9ALTE|nr:mannonate dehydratase [Alteromonas gilva]MDC8831871.1 mannonate dehydratase [Alteromonas gilva]